MIQKFNVGFSILRSLIRIRIIALLPDVAQTARAMKMKIQQQRIANRVYDDPLERLGVLVRIRKAQPAHTLITCRERVLTRRLKVLS